MKSKEEVKAFVDDSIGWKQAVYAEQPVQVDYETCLHLVSSFADQETAQLKQEHDRIVKAYDITNKSWVDQMNELSLLRTENERLKRKIDNLERMRITGSRI